MRTLRFRMVWLCGGLLLIAAVVGLSLIPFPPVVLPPTLQDKTGHVIAYFVLMLWFTGLWPRRAHWWLVAAFIFMGAGLEVVQGYIPSRFFDYRDMLANSIGALSGLALARLGVDKWAQAIERVALGVTEPVDG